MGAGFIGPVHVEALRRLGVTITGILGVDDRESTSAQQKLGLPRAYKSIDEVLGDKEVHAVHLAVPNVLHYALAKKVLLAGKHVLCEKPLAMHSKESAELVELAKGKKVAAAVCYNVRFYPLNLEAYDMVRRGDVGQIFHVNGSYTQDWLYYDTDYNWRVLAEQGGELRAISDIGTHWMDLLTTITGLEVESVYADLQTVHPIRKRPKGEVQTYTGKAAAPVETEGVNISTEDYGAVLFRFQGGAKGTLHVSQVTAGRKNCLRYEIAGSKCSLAWNSEAPNEMRDRPPHQGERAADPRPVAAVGPGAALLHLPRRPQRRLPRRLQELLPRLLRVHRQGRLRRRAALPDVRRRTSFHRPVRRHPQKPPRTEVGSRVRRAARRQPAV